MTPAYRTTETDLLTRTRITSGSHRSSPLLRAKQNSPSPISQIQSYIFLENLTFPRKFAFLLHFSSLKSPLPLSAPTSSGTKALKDICLWRCIPSLSFLRKLQNFLEKASIYSPWQMLGKGTNPRSSTPPRTSAFSSLAPFFSLCSSSTSRNPRILTPYPPSIATSLPTQSHLSIA